MERDPAALPELGRLGVPLVPAVAVGDRAVHGWNPSAYADLLGVAYAPPAPLPPAELAARLDRILACAEGLIRQVPEDRLGYRPPERDRDLRDLAYHIFRLSLAFAEGMETGALPQAWLQEPAPPDLRDGAAVARYGALVRGRLGRWFEGAGPGALSRVIEVYYGPQPGHALLERTAWHAAQHLRQLYALAERLDLRPERPLPAADLEGLPLPESLW